MVSNTSGYYLRAIASAVIPRNTAQFYTISRNSSTIQLNSAQFPAIPRNGIPIGDPIKITDDSLVNNKKNFSYSYHFILIAFIKSINQSSTMFFIFTTKCCKLVQTIYSVRSNLAKSLKFRDEASNQFLSDAKSIKFLSYVDCSSMLLKTFILWEGLILERICWDSVNGLVYFNWSIFCPHGLFPIVSHSTQVHFNLSWTDLYGPSLYCPAWYTNYCRRG